MHASCWSNVPRQFNLSDLLSLQAVLYHSEQKKSRQPHVCGNKYCDTCKMFMSDDYVCYMKTTAEEEATKLLKRKRKKRTMMTMLWKNEFSLTLNAHKTRGFSAIRSTNLSSISCVEIAINPTVIPIHANKDTFQRRCQFALIVTDHPVVPSDTFPIYVSYIKFAKNALAKTKSTNIASVMFVSTKSEYSIVLTHVTNSVNGCFRMKTKNRTSSIIIFEGTIVIPL